MTEPVPDGWAEVDGALERTFRFDTFAGAIAFVTAVASLAVVQLLILYHMVMARAVVAVGGGSASARDFDLSTLEELIAQGGQPPTV